LPFDQDEVLLTGVDVASHQIQVKDLQWEYFSSGYFHLVEVIKK
jgi:hypothetical protein